MFAVSRLDPATLERLLDPHAEARDAALDVLKKRYVVCDRGSCTTDREVAQAALPYAQRALIDSDPEIRIAGARVIELLASDAARMIPQLVQTLADPVSEVRIAALEALAEFGSAAASAAPSIASLGSDSMSPEERAAAAQALANIEL
jgi:HEAT repeat protein